MKSKSDTPPTTGDFDVGVPSAKVDAHRSKELEEPVAPLIKHIAVLEANIEELKEKKKDGWDKFQIVAALLIPASIALVGYMVSEASKEAEIESSKAIVDAQNKSAERIAFRQLQANESQSKVSQAQLVLSYLEALTSKEAQTRKVAIEAILIALPEDGPRLVEIVRQTDTDESVKTVAIKALDALTERRRTLYNETRNIISTLVREQNILAEENRETRRFWELYSEDLIGIESREVATAMINFGNELKKLYGKEPSDELERLSKKVINQIDKELND